MPDYEFFAKKLCYWYEKNKRDLPWRHTNDPYKIWLSEIILQQTRVIQGLPYYNRFISRFPDVMALAQAKEEEVLRIWQGLGYYSRARNLHKCAQVIAYDYQGQFPDTYDQLIKLPGIGPYTAAAIASFAFNLPHAVVDGNVYRVLARVFGVDMDIAKPRSQRAFQQLANQLIDQNKPGLYNQGIMEFGATLCTPKAPSCSDCPINQHCHAFSENLQDQLPVKTKAKPPRIRYFYYLVIEKDGCILMRERKSKDIWQGLFEFILTESEKEKNEEDILQQVDIPFDVLDISTTYKHVLSHQIIYARFFHIRMKMSNFVSDKLSGHFYSKDQIQDLPKPVLILKYIDDSLF